VSNPDVYFEMDVGASQRGRRGAGDAKEHYENRSLISSLRRHPNAPKRN
jgi:hypothetical protein